MQPHRRRARPAIEGEAHRPRAWGGAGHGVGGGEHRRLRVAGRQAQALAQHRDEGRLHGVGQGAAVGQHHAVVLGDGRAGEQALSALAQARWFHRLEMTSNASSRYEMDEWRAQWGKSAAGRAKLIARLEAATPSQVSREEAGAETGASSGEAAGVAVRAEDASAASNGAAAPRVKDEGRTKTDDDDDEDMGADEV